MKQIKLGHISSLGVTPELFELMAQNASIDPKKSKINRKLIKRELKARKKKNLIKGLR